MIWPGLAAEAMSLATLWTGRLAPLIPSCSVSVWAGSEARRGEGRAGGEGVRPTSCLVLTAACRTPHLSALPLCLFGIGSLFYVKKIKENDL